MFNFTQSLPWDGSHLGKLEQSDILMNIPLGTLKYIKLCVKDTNGTTGYLHASYITSSNLLPIIIDECKYLFGVPKNGTHSIYIGKRLYILYYIKAEDNEIKWDVSLSSLHKDHELRTDLKCNHEIRKILAFRYLFSLRINSESRVLVREHEGNFIFMSSDEKKIDEVKNGIPGVNTMKKWFGVDYYNINDTLAEMVSYDPQNNDSLKIVRNICNSMEEIIRKYDYTHLSLAYFVSGRLTTLLNNI